MLFRSLGKKSKAEVPKESDAKKIGDTQVAAEIFLPTETSAGTNWFTLTSPDGISEPRPLLFLAAVDLIDEKEPNGGFREAQAMSNGATMSGNIKEVGDVDVFRFEGAASVGSALDSLLTLYDAQGNLLASNDDAGNGRDSRLEFRLKAAGTHYVSVMDANDKAGPTHVYLLRVAQP